MIKNEKKLSFNEVESLLEILKERFEKNIARHQDIKWIDLQTKLENNMNKLWSLNEMEKTGGEPDVIKYDKKTNEFVFYDCSVESPLGRRNVCYDYKALMSRKQHKPQNNAIDMANAMGTEILNEEQYKELQKIGKFDTKTSSLIKTDDDIRTLRRSYFRG